MSASSTEHKIMLWKVNEFICPEKIQDLILREIKKKRSKVCSAHKIFHLARPEWWPQEVYKAEVTGGSAADVPVWYNKFTISLLNVTD